MNDTTNTTTTTTTTAAPPWHEGKLDAELVGHIQNKGWKIEDPALVATEAVKAHRELQKHFGVPESQLIKLPKDLSDEAGWKAVHERLGVPKEAKDYEFTGIKHADGKDVEQAITDAIRAAAHNARVPKDRAGDVLKSVVKVLDDKAAADAADFTAKLAVEKTNLAKNWGTTPEKLDVDPKMAFARIGAQRAGVPPEGVKALENQIGYAAVMELFRKIGAGTSEDAWVEGKGAGDKTAMTKEGAKARLAELQADPAWGKRLVDGGAAERREFDALTNLIAA